MESYSFACFFDVIQLCWLMFDLLSSDVGLMFSIYRKAWASLEEWEVLVNQMFKIMKEACKLFAEMKSIIF